MKVVFNSTFLTSFNLIIQLPRLFQLPLLTIILKNIVTRQLPGVMEDNIEK